ncbi:DUF1028 domain-containing protein [Kitasatospora sp. NPDC059571]|uniref:DUF1028 domain-containing protein n=1 Tax=Kitasatospora sp. NPDC059571 TaxID=3346871 RepID=UPI0036B13B74
MTFSVAGRCRRTGQFGVALASSSPAVAARCAHVRPGVGAACSQNVTDPRLGPHLLDLLAAGVPAGEAVRRTAEEGGELGRWRQLTAIGNGGRAGAHSGDRALGTHAQALGPDAVAAGNLLAGPGVPQAMLDAFEAWPHRPLAQRLMDALTAGVHAGGEAGPLHAAGLLVAGAVPWPVVDLRVDWSERDPVAELDVLWRIWEPQQEDYVRRALDPAAAPAFGVPGDA